MSEKMSADLEKRLDAAARWLEGFVIGSIGLPAGMSAKDHADTLREAAGAITALQAEVDELRRWKAEALAVEAEWDAQAIGKLLGLAPGASIRASIQPAIERLQAEADRLREALEIQGAALLEARETFQEYVRLHRAKSPPDETKAQADFQHADKIGMAIAKASELLRDHLEQGKPEPAADAE